MVASTRASEKGLRRAGVTAFEKVYLHPGHHAAYYPGAKPIHLELLLGLPEGRVLGAQAGGGRGRREAHRRHRDGAPVGCHGPGPRRSGALLRAAGRRRHGSRQPRGDGGREPPRRRHAPRRPGQPRDGGPGRGRCPRGRRVWHGPHSRAQPAPVADADPLSRVAPRLAARAVLRVGQRAYYACASSRRTAVASPISPAAMPPIALFVLRGFRSVPAKPYGDDSVSVPHAMRAQKRSCRT